MYMFDLTIALSCLSDKRLKHAKYVFFKEQLIWCITFYYKLYKGLSFTQRHIYAKNVALDVVYLDTLHSHDFLSLHLIFCQMSNSMLWGI